MNTANTSAPITANITVRLTLPLTSPAIYEENWKPMNWNSITPMRPASPIKPGLKEKSGDPSEKPAFVAALNIASEEVPRAGKALFTASGEMKMPPKKLIATEMIAKMVSPVTTRWKVRVLKIEMPKITSRMIMPRMAWLM